MATNKALHITWGYRDGADGVHVRVMQQDSKGNTMVEKNYKPGRVSLDRLETILNENIQCVSIRFPIASPTVLEPNPPFGMFIHFEPFPVKL